MTKMQYNEAGPCVVILLIRAAPIPGIGIGIGIVPIPAIFDGIGIGQVCYTSTSSVDCTLLTMKHFLLKSSS